MTSTPATKDSYLEGLDLAAARIAVAAERALASLSTGSPARDIVVSARTEVLAVVNGTRARLSVLDGSTIRRDAVDSRHQIDPAPILVDDLDEESAVRLATHRLIDEARHAVATACAAFAPPNGDPAPGPAEDWFAAFLDALHGPAAGPARPQRGPSENAG